MWSLISSTQEQWLRKVSCRCKAISKCNGQRRLRWKTTVQVDAGYTPGSCWQVVLVPLLMQDFFCLFDVVGAGKPSSLLSVHPS